MSAALVLEGQVRVTSPQPMWEAGAPTTLSPAPQDMALRHVVLLAGLLAEVASKSSESAVGSGGLWGRGGRAWPVQSWGTFPLPLGLGTVWSEVPVLHTAPNTCPPLRSRPFHVSAPGVLSP